MRRYWPIAVILILLLVVSAAVVAVARSDSDAFDELLEDLDISTSDENEIRGSGFIEAVQVSVGSDLGGEIARVTVDEGDEVSAGDALVELASETLEAQLKQAEAAVTGARAQLERLETGARPEEVRQVEASVAQAEAARDGAEQAWQDALATVRNPQQMDLQIGRAETEMSVAQQQLAAGQARLQAAAAGRDQAEDRLDTAEAAAAAGVLSSDELAQARLQFDQVEDVWLQAQMAVDMAEVQLAGASIHLDNLRAMRDDPREGLARVDAARARFDAATAAADGAAAQLALVQAGASDTQVLAATAGVRQAEARLAALGIQLDKLTLTAPMDGTVIEVLAREGENTVPGAALVRVARLHPVELTVFVAETEVGDLEIGTPVEVTVDAFEDETFDGEVIAIASEAEFTPKNVQTKEERANLVFAVRVELPNEDESLKPGMPADAVITIE